MIELKNYTLKNKSKVMIENQNLEILNDINKILFIGENGSGKTTFINNILCLKKNYTGTQKLNIKNTDISVSFQKNNLINTYSVINMIKYHFWLNNIKMSNDELMLKLKKWGISDIKNKEISKLSGGEEKKVSIIMSEMLNSKLWILDEPTNNLDSASKKLLKEEIENYKNKIMCISHDQFILDYVSFDALILIKNKKLYILKDYKKFSFIELKKDSNLEVEKIKIDDDNYIGLLCENTKPKNLIEINKTNVWNMIEFSI